MQGTPVAGLRGQSSARCGGRFPNLRRGGQAFLRRLERTGQARDVVFLDMDALVIAPMAPAFALEAAAGVPFDLALTLSDAVDMCAARHGLSRNLPRRCMRPVMQPAPWPCCTPGPMTAC